MKFPSSSVSPILWLLGFPSVISFGNQSSNLHSQSVKCHKGDVQLDSSTLKPTLWCESSNAVFNRFSLEPFLEPENLFTTRIQLIIIGNIVLTVVLLFLGSVLCCLTCVKKRRVQKLMDEQSASRKQMQLIHSQNIQHRLILSSGERQNLKLETAQYSSRPTKRLLKKSENRERIRSFSVSMPLPGYRKTGLRMKNRGGRTPKSLISRSNLEGRPRSPKETFWPNDGLSGESSFRSIGDERSNRSVISSMGSATSSFGSKLSASSAVSSNIPSTQQLEEKPKSHPSTTSIKK